MINNTFSGQLSLDRAFTTLDILVSKNATALDVAKALAEATHQLAPSLGWNLEVHTKFEDLKPKTDAVLARTFISLKNSKRRSTTTIIWRCVVNDT